MEVRAQMTPEERMVLLTPCKAAQTLGIETRDVHWLIEHQHLETIVEWETLAVWINPNVPPFAPRAGA